MADDAVVTRFAPSPTGSLHIGGARTALFCWALARRAGERGRFLLRVEDTDQKRSSREAADGILRDLAWLGIGWDEGPEWSGPGPGADGAGFGGDPRGVGPFFQSERLDRYGPFFDRLLDAGLAYPAFESPEELAGLRKAAEAEKRTFIYRQPTEYDAERELARAKSQPHVLRFRTPDEPVRFRDEILGEVTVEAGSIDDFVIRKRDGFPTYHFAVVVDDELMGVTDVLRGQEHLSNTPRHVALQRALGFREPRFAHLPIIANPDGSKMSKRDKDKALKAAVRGAEPGPDPGGHGVPADEFAAWLKDKSKQLAPAALASMAAELGVPLPEIEVNDFRAAGYPPGVVINFIALLGWNPGEKAEDGTDLERFDAAYLAERFELARVGKSTSRFDRDKLLAFSGDTIQHATADAAFADDWLAWAREHDPGLAAWAEEDAARWRLAAKAARPRARTLRDARDAIGFALTPDDAVAFDDKAVKKVLLKGEPAGDEVLAGLGLALAAVGLWEPDPVEAAIGVFAESRGLGMGKVAQPLRVALTGTTVSPPLGETVCLLSRVSVAARVERCVAHAEAVAASR